MAKKHDKLYYMKKCRDCLIEISKLGPTDAVLFLRLKRKAAKFLEKAKALEALEKKVAPPDLPSIPK